MCEFPDLQGLAEQKWVRATSLIWSATYAKYKFFNFSTFQCLATMLMSLNKSQVIRLCSLISLRSFSTLVITNHWMKLLRAHNPLRLGWHDGFGHVAVSLITTLYWESYISYIFDRLCHFTLLAVLNRWCLLHTDFKRQITRGVLGSVSSLEKASKFRNGGSRTCDCLRIDLVLLLWVVAHYRREGGSRRLWTHSQRHSQMAALEQWYKTQINLLERLHSLV